MKNLQETLKNRMIKERKAWKNYSKCFITQVNRLLEYMGKEKDFSMNDLQDAMEKNFYKNYICKTLTKKALACNIVDRYSYVQYCFRKWIEAVKEVTDIEVEIMAESFME